MFSASFVTSMFYFRLAGLSSYSSVLMWYGELQFLSSGFLWVSWYNSLSVLHLQLLGSHTVLEIVAAIFRRNGKLRAFRYKSQCMVLASLVGWTLVRLQFSSMALWQVAPWRPKGQVQAGWRLETVVYKPEENDKEIGVPFRMPSFSTWEYPWFLLICLGDFWYFLFWNCFEFHKCEKMLYW